MSDRDDCRCGHAYAKHEGCCGRYPCTECDCDNYNTGVPSDLPPLGDMLRQLFIGFAQAVKNNAARRDDPGVQLIAETCGADHELDYYQWLS